MRIRVQFFASLKDIVGKSEMSMTIAETATPRSVFQELESRFPELTRYRPLVLIAINQEYKDWDTRMAPGDEIVFFPPISGGSS